MGESYGRSLGRPLKMKSETVLKQITENIFSDKSQLKFKFKFKKPLLLREIPLCIIETVEVRYKPIQLDWKDVYIAPEWP